MINHNWNEVYRMATVTVKRVVETTIVLNEKESLMLRQLIDLTIDPENNAPIGKENTDLCTFAHRLLSSLPDLEG